MAISLQPFHDTPIPAPISGDTDVRDSDAMHRSSATPMSPTDLRYRECLDNARRVCAAGTVPTMLVIGGPEMAAVRCNEALASLLNHPRAATRDESGPTLLPGGWPAVADALRPLYGVGSADGPATPPDGAAVQLPTEPPLSLRATPLLVDGRVVGVLATATLDGAIAKLEEAMRAEVARTTAARSRFLASASHDLRQPFQAMRLFLDALTTQVEGNARATRTAGMLANAMTAGEQLLNALLDISTLDAGTVEADLQPVSLDALLQSLADEFRPQAEEKGLRLRVHLPCRAFTRSDPILLGRIIRNLLANAIRYTQRGGILLGLRKRDGHWRIEVWDTGFGIPQDKLDVIFDEFHQLTNPARDPTRGLGLGLAIVRRLSVLLSAPIDVRSRSGRGSVFAVTVDRLEGEEALADTQSATASADQAAAAVPLDGMRILVVDDDSMVLSGLLLTLESWGCAFVSASNMREVFAAVDGLEGPPDAILTDLRLPGKVSGFDVIDRVRKLFKADIPAVVLTGETAPESLLEGQRRGCAFLHKPLHPGELRRVLEEVRRDGTAGC
ncbi:histidine kinase [Azospirillum sp. TSH7]|uniref:ATP-binding response regulator n=1 Tax=unclassified Azospirillum TaxID=2630922 RepID=UPI000D61D689|nr:MULTISPECIES: hybrid sensor histidine kinase/response regulator [unclassified Azospirillum]PWC57273.1 histidine kinase [Azospirillum sp. TSH20]PWC61238.1 histidine kinase [Azospirillum sp. TSH7]